MTPRMSFAEAIKLEMAYIQENYFFTESEMVKVALKQFKQKQMKTGTGEDYKKEA